MSSHFSVLFLNLLCANYDKKKTESRRNTCFPLITAHRGLSVRGWTHKPTSAQDFNFSLQTPVSVGVSQELFCVFIAIFLQVKTRCPGLCKLLIDHSFLSFCFAKMCVCFSLFGFVSILAASVHFPALQSPSKYVAALSGPCFVVRTWACRRSKPAPEYISYHPPPLPHGGSVCCLNWAEQGEVVFLSWSADWAVQANGKTLKWRPHEGSAAEQELQYETHIQFVVCW